MQNEIIINAASGETRAALIQKNSFDELHIERTHDRTVVGNVVKGRVTRVLPGMQAAFVDIGLEKAAFLYVGDYIDEKMMQNGGGKNGRRRGRASSYHMPKIENLLREGQEIVVQVAKEPIGTKGARITSNISIAGRHLVLTPWGRRVGVSRRIDSERERRRLKEIVARLRPDDLGFIIRTAGETARDADIEADVRYLSTVWNRIQEKRKEAPAPSVLYTELSLPLRIVRDFADSKTSRIVVDSKEVYDEMTGFVENFVAEPKPKIEFYDGSTPIFDHFTLEHQIDANLGKKALLKSGGYLIIDQCEALTAIDVNTGRFVGKRDLEDTVLKTNLEAVKEVVHQLRFRNIGGLIIIDLIDMESAANREKVYRALQEALRQDKQKTNILKISELGLVEMTRKRTRENLVQSLCEPCSHCEGRGFVQSRETVAYKVLREIRKDLMRFCGRKIVVSVHPDVAAILLTQEKAVLDGFCQLYGRSIEIHAQAELHQEHFEVAAVDSGEPVKLEISWLQDRKTKGNRDKRGNTQNETRRQSTTSEDSASDQVGAEDEQNASHGNASGDSGFGALAAQGENHGDEPPAAEKSVSTGLEVAVIQKENEPTAKSAAETLDVQAESPILPAPEK